MVLIPVIPALWKSRPMAREFKASLGNMVKPHLYNKIQKLAGCSGTDVQSQLATQEAKVGGSPQPRKVEAAVSHDHATALRSRWQSEGLSQ